MKRTWKILALLLIALTVLSLFAACGEDTPVGPVEPPPVTPPDDGQKPPSTLAVSVIDIDFSRGDFKMSNKDGVVTLSTPYDGEPHMLTNDNYEGRTEPERASLVFEYYQNGVKIAAYDEDLDQIFGEPKYADGITEAGTYDVKLVFSADKYTDGIKSAKMVISASYPVEYVVGMPTGSGIPAMTVPTTNPTHFTTDEYGLTLYNPTLDSEKVGYNFRGWYTAADCAEASRITEIDGVVLENSGLLASGSLKLYAKFEACVAYPPLYKDNTTDNRVTTAPDTLPAIPGYEDMDPTAHKLLDMSILSTNGTGLGYGYNTIASLNPNNDNIYGLSKEPSVETAGGQYAIQWQDPSDIWDRPVAGTSGATAQVHTPGDGYFGAMLSFQSPLRGFNYDNYDTIEFWMYNANNTGNVITMLVFINGDDKTSMYIDLKLDFSGWKKFTLHFSDFQTSSGMKNFNVSKINFYGYPTSGGTHSEQATLGLDKNPNFVYLSDFFLTNTASDYSKSTSNGLIPNAAELPKMLTQLAALSVTDSISDADVDAALEMLADNSKSDTGSFWLDLTPTDSYGVKECYKRLAELAEVWNNPASKKYYRNADLLNTIAAGLNYMHDGAAKLVNAHTPVDSYYEEAAYYLVKTVVNISDYINTKHAQSWMVPVLHFVQAPIGTGDRLVKTAYTFACANALAGNSRGYMTGIRSLMSAMKNNRITLAMNPASINDVTALILSAYNTPFMTANDAKTNNILNAMLDWFYYSIDSLLVNGKVPSQIAALEGHVALESYVRGMLIIYDILPAASKDKFASAVKYYMAQDTTLEATIKANAHYNAELAGLDAVKASSATAASPTPDANVIRTFESIGQVFVKNGEQIILIDRLGTTIGASISALDCKRIYTSVIGDVVAIATDDRAIFIADGTATEKYFPTENATADFNSGDTYVVVTASAAATIAGASANGSISEVDGAPIIVGTTVVDGKLVVNIYNYTQATSNITVNLNGTYTAATSDNLYSISNESGMTSITVNLMLEEGEQIRKSTENYFEITLESQA